MREECTSVINQASSFRHWAEKGNGKKKKDRKGRVPRARTVQSQREKMSTLGKKEVDGQIVYFSVAVLKSSQTLEHCYRKISVVVKLTEDVRAQEAAGPYAAVSCYCRPLVTFFLCALQ